MRFSFLSLLGALALAGGCFDVERVTGGPPLGYETDPRSCSNGYDDDNDGLVDCLDPDCIRRNLCGEIVPLLPPSGSEISVRECTDGVDNDLDGQFDCGDRGCQAIRELCCVSEFDDVSCSDRIDNDGNGFADCQDFSCRNNPFVTVCGRESNCNDDFDNDNDGLTDCDDPDCEMDEMHCDYVPPPIEPENVEERCIDGVDNDDNGFVDCGDFGCCTRDGICISPAVQEFCDNRPTETSLDACMDGEDNDGNGFVDCADFSCSRSADPEVLAYCASVLENTPERCTDGIDNDGNGFRDCDEFSCCRDGVCIDPSIDAYCLSVGERTFERCTNGIDEDDNGFADCADFSCQDVLQNVLFERIGGVVTTTILEPGVACSPFRAECEDEGNRCSCREMSPCSETVVAVGDFVDPTEEFRALGDAVQRCTDGFDGDLDGFVDCDDWDCQWHPLLNPSTRPRPEGEEPPPGEEPPEDEDPPPGLCQGGRVDRNVPGYWRPLNEGETPLVEPAPLLCR